jgi:hypothetical protein
MAQIRIVNGTYRNKSVAGQVFELVSQFQKTAKSAFVTVRNSGQFPGFPETIRVNVEGPQDYQFTSDAPASVPTAPVVEAVVETDEEAIARIRERFEILTDMTKAATSGDIRAMIVSGPPGVGKSHGVEQEIEKACLFDKIAGKRLRAEVVKGSATPIGLYQTLYKYSDANCVVVFDDCDSILLDDVSLNLLKGALDSGKKRKISWLSESSTLRREGIPDQFEFKGSVIFITNIKFSNVKGKLKDHLDALQSRCHYVDLTIDTVRDKLLRIKQLINDGMLNDYNFTSDEADELVNFVESNQARLRELSLRTVIKLADLRKAFPDRWQRFAETSLLK